MAGRTAASSKSKARSRTTRTRKRSQPAETGVAADAIALPAECTIREAPALQSLLLEYVDVDGAVIVDGSAVERIDTAGLQLLLAFGRDRASGGRTVTWQAPGEPLVRAAALTGLAALLGLEHEHRE